MSVVYFIQQGDSGPIKIGVATDVWKRLGSLQVSTVEPLHLRAMLPGGRETEKRLHQQFAAFRVRGEWFLPVDDVRELFALSLPLPERTPVENKRGGRKKKDRMPEKEAKAIWRSLEYVEDWRALQHMPGWTQRSAYRWLGPRGIRVGRPKTTK